MKLSDDQIEEKIIALIGELEVLMKAETTPGYVKVNCCRVLGRTLKRYHEMFSRAEPENMGLRSVKKDF